MLKWTTPMLFVLLGSALLFPDAVYADEPRSRSYDFSETVITSEARVPGLSMILGDEFAPRDCPQLDPDEFRRCLGEVRDVFHYVPPGDSLRMDIVLLPMSPADAEKIARVARMVVGSLQGRKLDPRVLVVPHPSALAPGDKHLARIPPYFEWTRSMGSIAVQGIRAAGKGLGRETREFDAIDQLKRLVSIPLGEISSLREGATALIVAVSHGEVKASSLEPIRAALNERYGPGGWGATAWCSGAGCEAVEGLTRRATHEVVRLRRGGLGLALERGVDAAVERINRWTLSHNPGLSGHLELRSGGIILNQTHYAYDPFERRVRVSDLRLPAGMDKNVIEAWYFPFDPRQGLARACPASVEKPKRKGKKRRRNRRKKKKRAVEGPCAGWAADEVIGPSPRALIDVAFHPAPRARSPSDALLFQGVGAFQVPFARSGVDVRTHLDSGHPKWREGTFRVIVTDGKTLRGEGARADAVIQWDGEWDVPNLEVLGWRVVNRSVSVPISGMPIIYDTLHVYLNGRRIELATGEGAGYLLRGGHLHLDVAAPLHPRSHLFFAYRKEE